MFAIILPTTSATAVVIIKATKNTERMNDFPGNSKRPQNVLWSWTSVTDVEMEVTAVHGAQVWGPHTSVVIDYDAIVKYN